MRLLFENHTLDTERRELLRGRDTVVIEPQVFDLLVYLVENRERVVSKDEMIAAIWGGRIVSESTLTSRINAVRRAVDDSGNQQRLIRTYSRKGIRFIGEIRTGDFSTVAAEARSESPSPPPPPPHGKPCIAVLPFDNLSSDPEQEYFSDGITEDILTALSKYRSIQVLARNATFVMRNQLVDHRQIGRDLGADYVVQGSVRRIGNRARITARLVATTSGQTLWAENYDRELADIFEVQDEITATVAARIEPEIGNAERDLVERKSPRTFDAWDLFRIGTKFFYKSTSADNYEAQKYFRRAINLDPSLAEAYGFLAYAIVLGMLYFEQDSEDARLDEAIGYAKQGIALDERDALIRFMYGRALLARKQYDEALVELAIAAELNPNLAVVYCGLGDSLAYEGRFGEAIPFFERAIKLSPNDPMRWAFYSYRALAHLFAGDYEQAAEWGRNATRVPNCHYLGFAHRVAALGFLDRPDEMRTAILELNQKKPGVTCDFVRKRLFYVKNPDHIAVYIAGLRRAGIA